MNNFLLYLQDNTTKEAYVATFFAALSNESP